MKTLKKEIFDNLDAEVIKKLKKMDIYAAIKEMKENKYTNRDNLLFNDIEVLEKIDSMDISPEFKAALYVSYNPYLLTMEQWNEYITYFMDKNSNRPFYSLYKKNVKNVRVLNTINSIYYFNNDILSFLYKDTIFTKKNKLPEEAYRVNESHFDDYLLTQTYHFRRFIEYMLSFPNPKVELVNRLYLVDNFLTNADDNETYQDYYKKHPEINSIFKEDGTIDLMKFKNDSAYIFQLWEVFDKNRAGAMGENVNKGVTKKLETISKAVYLRLIETNITCKNLPVLNDLLKSINLSFTSDIRTTFENMDILIKIVFEKIGKEENVKINRILPLLDKMNVLNFVNDFNNSILNENTTIIVDKVLENKDILTLNETIALYLAILDKEIWNTRGNAAASITLLSELVQKDIKKTCELLEYIELHYNIVPVKMKNWKNADVSEILSAKPEDILEKLNDTEKTRTKNSSMIYFRNYFNGTDYLY